MQVVHEQQALHERVGDEQRLQALLIADGPHDRLKPRAVEADKAGDEFLGDVGRLRARPGPEFGEQRLDARPSLPGVNLPGVRWRRPCQIASVMPVGECVVLSTLPPPRYMCTPQGRHGSKLRTARMMSMPLKLSGGFSSKIGVFCTASS